MKTKIVYCKDANRQGDFGQASFDFLGYTFRGRLAQGPRGYFTGFNPAISGKAKKAKGQQIRDWHLNRRGSANLSGLADAINPQWGACAGRSQCHPHSRNNRPQAESGTRDRRRGGRRPVVGPWQPGPRPLPDDQQSSQRCRHEAGRLRRR